MLTDGLECCGLLRCFYQLFGDGTHSLIPITLDGFVPAYCDVFIRLFWFLTWCCLTRGLAKTSLDPGVSVCSGEESRAVAGQFPRQSPERALGATVTPLWTPRLAPSAPILSVSYLPLASAPLWSPDSEKAGWTKASPWRTPAGPSQGSVHQTGPRRTALRLDPADSRRECSSAMRRRPRSTSVTGHLFLLPVSAGQLDSPIPRLARRRPGSGPAPPCPRAAEPGPDRSAARARAPGRWSPSGSTGPERRWSPRQTDWSTDGTPAQPRHSQHQEDTPAAPPHPPQRLKTHDRHSQQLQKLTSVREVTHRSHRPPSAIWTRSLLQRERRVISRAGTIHRFWIDSEPRF